MKRIFTRLPGVLSLIAVLGLTVSSRAVEDRVIGVSAGDRAMNQAIENARNQLSHFWKVLAAPKNGEDNFCLKVRIKADEKVEHLWCTDIRIEKGMVSGAIGNDPEIVKSVRLGQRISIKEADISDWLYIKADKMIGNYTVRPLMCPSPSRRAGNCR
ncbi:MAG: DUF2314 domain-containing protein [Opitutae bacterium]|nr:DUF2314 domain-containing protein [Opitutae bacterium]